MSPQQRRHDMYRRLKSLALGLVVAGLSGTYAVAMPNGSAMREGEYKLAPFPFVKFCSDYPGECSGSRGAARVELTAELYRELAEVNQSVNASIRPTPDTSLLRYWTLNATAGDCNSFAIQKRHE